MMKNRIGISSRVLAVACVTSGLAACGTEESVRADPMALIDALELGRDDASFSDVVPEANQTVIGRRGDVERRTHASSRGLDAADAVTIVDASGDRVVFPMPRDVRSFADYNEVVEWLAATFGASEVTRSEDGAVGATGRYAQFGSSFFDDRRVGVRFLVTDPLLAYLAGVEGIVEVGGERVCFDTDGDCSTRHASYLAPEGELTAPPSANLCGAYNVCVRFTSFYNKVYFPVIWARHGSNSAFYTYAALPTSQLYTAGHIVTPNEYGNQTYAIPEVSGTGVNSVESAVWSFSPSSLEFNAVAICGFGMVNDPDVAGGEMTANGPQGASACW